MSAPEVSLHERKDFNILVNFINSDDAEGMSRFLGSGGVDLRQIEQYGNVALLNVASYLGRPRCVKLLLERGWNPNILSGKQPNKQTSPLLMAVQQNHLDCVKILLEAKADPNLATVLGNSPLVQAAVFKDPSILKILISHGGNVHACTSAGSSLLSLAVRVQSVATVEVLMEYGCDVNLADQNHATPLLLAVQDGNIDIVRLLLKAPGILVNKSLPGGVSPLYVAAHAVRSYILIINHKHIHQSTRTYIRARRSFLSLPRSQ
jgi:ankyrin repeat protein